MQKLGQIQTLTQKLSPQQIQFIKLLQIPTAELQTRIEEELSSNPALEEGRNDEEFAESETNNEESSEEDFDEDLGDIDNEALDNEDEFTKDTESIEEISVGEYLNDDDIGYKMQGDGPSMEDDKEMPIRMEDSLIDSLMEQLEYLDMNEREFAIGMQLIGSIDNEGYIRRELEGIVNDLAFTQNIETSEAEVENILKKIQNFDPPGIAARNLQECLELQLKRKDHNIIAIHHALKIISLCFEEFTKKHYPKIEKRLDITEEELKEAVNIIIKLNPKPGESGTTYTKTQYVVPDFILKNNSGKLELGLNARNAPDLRISRSFAEMLDTYEKSSKRDKSMKQAVTFVKQKLDAAKWFIDAIKQRQQTLLKTMNAIVDYQYDYFLEGDESKLRPMILKDIANKISMDISTVSRVANSKTVQTDFGIYPLKYFFSESITTDSGEDVSSKEVKYILKEIIDNENKRKPYSDDKLEKMLNDKGYNIARRTVAKYREQMNIPVARLRKEL
ncbi:MAG: RNA polymerase factor sigma-54 [Thermoflexibacter sp.]|jgi:RNA polymerase sigma-54 factor|nr:RNA polymerase factor sigma-54 [Thermoflexibacter sp.]